MSSPSCVTIFGESQFSSLHFYAGCDMKGTWSCAAAPAVEALERRLLLTALPPGFTETLVTTNTGLSGAMTMQFSPTGQLWVLEQGGKARLIRANGTAHTAVTLAVDSRGERGLLGIAFDPAYDGAGPNADRVFLSYVT